MLMRIIILIKICRVIIVMFYFPISFASVDLEYMYEASETFYIIRSGSKLHQILEYAYTNANMNSNSNKKFNHRNIQFFNVLCECESEHDNYL